MVQDSIMEKLRKIKALMDGGEAGEVEAARLALERLMEANGLTWDDIMDEKRTTRAVKYANQDEFKILLNLLAHLFGSKSETFQKATYNKRAKEIYLDLTDVEAADVESMWSYYRRELKSGLKKAKGEFLDAFIYKFNLYNSTPDENRENKLSFEDLMRLKMIADGIKSSPYAKMIEHGKR